MSEKPYRVYNHTDRELIVATGDGKQYRLFPQSVSPASERPRLLWAASGAKIDGEAAWQLAEGFDVHVSETGSNSSLGGGTPNVSKPLGVTQNLRISGLGISSGKVPLDPTPRGAWFYREDEIWVTILGAGITGLTAAHELVARGIRVQVIERAHGSPADLADDPGEPPANPPTPPAGGAPYDAKLERFRRGLTRPDIGGIARTQWSTQPLEAAGTGVMNTEERKNGLEIPDWPETPAALRSVHGDAVWFGSSARGPCQMEAYRAFAITWTDGKADDLTAELGKWLSELSTVEGRSIAAVQAVIVIYGGGAPDRVKRGYDRFHDFLDTLRTKAPDTRTPEQKALRDMLDLLQVLPTARIDVAEPEPDKARHVGLMVRVHEDLGLIAGEHGFRFFPGFYRHLRDTMERTPIFDPLTGTFTPRTALDNLQEVEWQVIADPKRPNRTALSRRPFATIGGLIQQYHALRRDLGYRPIDLLRIALRTLRYMTSSIRRRRDHYESMSWWTFLTKRHLDDPHDEEVFRFGERFEEALRHAPRALVAMDPMQCDARTQGNITVQLLMDQFALHDQSDSTLVGPTSTTWLTHWRTYLEEQGVRFFLGEVTRIWTKAGRAKLDVAFPDGTPADYLDGEAMERRRIRAHYILSALDVVSLARVTRELRTPHAHHNPGALADLNRLIHDAAGRERDLEDITQIGRHGPGHGSGDRFQTLTGIQLYYRHHVSFANGHIYFAGTPWGLSAISQVQYWGPFGSGHRGRVFGNLSIDLGSWRAGKHAADPNECGRDEIAAEVQRQIDACTVGPGQRPLRRANYYHLDDFIGFGPSTREPGHHQDGDGDAKLRFVPTRNHAPFLINVKKEWHLRPEGEPWSPNDLVSRGRPAGVGTLNGATWTPARDGYPVHHDNLVIAGTHMRTFTRMTTMEAANESARHAVNAILDHATSKSDRFEQPFPEGMDRSKLDGGRIDGNQPNPDINVEKNTTRFGDYCDIWNPELFEFPDLQFLRLIDSHLMEAGSKTAGDDVPRDSHPRLAPHMFDILRIDELPEFLETDREAINALEMIGATLKAFDDARIDDLPGVLRAIERARKQLTGLFERAGK